MKHTKTILLCTGIAFLVGCAHFQPQPTFKYIPWQERKTKLQQNKNWIIDGSLSITHNKKRDIANFAWQQNQNNYAINISGPMNLRRVNIVGTANQVELCQSNNKCIKAKTGEQLFFNQFGWQLPISNMRYWVLALAAPTKIEATRFDQYEHLVALKQQGWKIYYSEFRPVKDVDLPNIIELQNKRFFIKIKIKNRS
jgi:outer membrane lipoprotein LolB